MKHSLAILLLCVAPAFAATRTASQTGNWNSTSTWGGASVPVSGDDVWIPGDLVVTIPNAYSAACLQIAVGSTANTSGTATLINNGTLTLDASGFVEIGMGASQDGKLTLGPGSLMTGPTFTHLYFNNGTFNAPSATKLNPAVIGGGLEVDHVVVSGPKQVINLANVSFRNSGQIDFPLQNTTGATASSLNISNCVFSGQRQITFGATDTLNTTVMSVGYSDFREMGVTHTITMRRVTGGAAAYEFVHNTLKQTYAGSPNAIQILPTTSAGLVIKQNVFDNAQIIEGSPGASIIQENFQTSRDSSSFVSLNNTSGGTVTRNYVYPSGDNQNGLTGNGTAGSGTHVICYNIFEGQGPPTSGYTDKPDWWLPNSTPLASNVLSNLIVGTGEIAVGYNAPNWLTLNLKNNTLGVTSAAASDSGGHLYVPENTASSGTINIANNVVRGNNNVTGIAIDGSASGANQVIAYSDYNTFYNENNVYSATRLTITAGNTGKTVPGGHDVATNPKFYDGTRNLAKWNSVFGSGTVSAEDGITYLLGINGYRGTPNFDQNGTASPLLPAHLRDYVWTGFLATNPALKSAGDPGDGSPTLGIGFTSSPQINTGFFAVQ